MDTDTDELPDLIEVAYQIAQKLEKLGIPYFISGSVASSLERELWSE